MLGERHHRRAGVRCIRISVCNWQTGFEDVDRSLEAMPGNSAA